MDGKREKDNLTDLVGEISASDDGSDNGGNVGLPTGEVVTLDFKTEMRKLENELKTAFKTDSDRIDFLTQLVVKLQQEITTLKQVLKKRR